MMQLKAIFSVLLRRYEFELAQPPESYRNDHSKMVVQLAQPAASATGAATARHAGRCEDRRVDLDLCQGHGVCGGEAPEVFAVDRSTGERHACSHEPPDDRSAPRVEAAVQVLPHPRALRSIED